MLHSCSFTLTLVFLLFLFFALWDRMGLRRLAATISANCEWGLFPETTWTLSFASLCFSLAGPSGTVVTLSGSGFGADPQLVSVTMNGAACNVTSTSDTEVRCTAGNNPGGTYLVALHHQVKGHAKSTVSFVYELTLSAVQPNQGKTEAIRPELKWNFKPSLWAISS